MHTLISLSVLCVTAGFLSLQTREVNSEKSGAYVMVSRRQLRQERKYILEDPAQLYEPVDSLKDLAQFGSRQLPSLL